MNYSRNPEKDRQDEINPELELTSNFEKDSKRREKDCKDAEKDISASGAH